MPRNLSPSVLAAIDAPQKSMALFLELNFENAVTAGSPPAPPPPTQTGQYDMLAWLTMPAALSAANHFEGTKLDGTASNPLYTQINAGNFYWIKGAVRYPWDIQIFDDNIIYLSTTELTYASATEGKRFESLTAGIGFKGVPFAKRFMNIGDSVLSTDTRFG